MDNNINNENNDIKSEDKNINNEISNEKIERTVYYKDAPYSNTSVWIIGFIFWPIAWAILAYISLKNLWNKYAKYILLWWFILTILICYILIYIIPETDELSLWFLWLMFMGFQQKYVKKWSEENPEKKYKSWWKAFWWWILWIITYFIIALIIVFIPIIFIFSWPITSDEIKIEKNYPNEVSLNDSFEIEFSITNVDSVNHELNSIDFENLILEWIIISDVTPELSSEYEAFWYYIYEFLKELLPNNENKVIFNAKANKIWDFSWNVDICIDNEFDCFNDSVNIIVK